MKQPLCALLAAAVLGIAACDRTVSVVDTAPRWKLDSLLTFSGPSADKPFSSVHGLALHTDGRLAVVDDQAKTATVFGPSGTFISPAAQSGGGPGDFNTPYYSTWIGNALAIYDPEMSRVLYTAHGSAKATTVTVMKVTGSLSARFYPVSPNKAYLRTVTIAGTTIKPVFVGFTEGKVADTVVVPDIAPLPVGTVCKAGEGGSTYFEWPEAAMILTLPVREDGSTAFVRTDDYRVVIKSAAGDSIGGFHHAFTPISIGNAEWSDGLLAYNKFLIKHGTTVCDSKPIRPQHKPPIRAITMSPEGDLWITSLRPDGLAFDVFSLDGTQKATMMAPEHDTAIPIAVAGDRVAVSVRSKTGPPKVRVYRIVR